MPDCPKCRAEVGDDDVICVSCGVNLQTGNSLETVVDKRPPESDGDEDPLSLNDGEDEGAVSGGSLFVFFASMVPGFFRPLVLILSLIFFLIAVGGTVLTLFLFSLGVVFGGVASGAATLLAYSHSVAWIITGRLQLLKDALMDFDSRRWALFFLFVAGPVIILFIAITVLGAHVRG